MSPKAFLSLLLVVLKTFLMITSVTATSDGETDLITLDKYSLSVRGERIFLFSGEFHYQRLPARRARDVARCFPKTES